MAVADFVTSAEVSAPAPGRGRGAGRAGACSGRGRGDDGRRRPEHQSRHPAPLRAPGAGGGDAAVPLRDALAAVLDGFDAADARDVFAAIRLANPGGLGRAARHDVTDSAAPRLAPGRHGGGRPARRIARAYVTAFDDVFAIGLPALAAARARGSPALAHHRPVSSPTRPACPTATWRASTAPTRAEALRAEARGPAGASISARPRWPPCSPGTAPGRRTRTQSRHQRRLHGGDAVPRPSPRGPRPDPGPSDRFSRLQAKVPSDR